MKKKLNCVFLGPFLYPHGFAATKRKQQFLDCIIENGDYARVFITLKWAKGHELNNNKGVFKGISYEVLGKQVRKNLLFPFTFLCFTVKSCFRLWSVRKKHTRNIIVAFGINYDTVLLLLFAKAIGYRVVFDIVEDFSTLIFSNSLKGKTKRWFLVVLPDIFERSLISGVTVITKYLFDKYKKYPGIPIEKVPVSAQNILIDKTQIKNYFINESQKFRLLYSGTYGEKEGFPTLIEAFSKLHKGFPDSQLVLTGNCPPPLKEKFLDAVQDDKAILFTGKLDEEDYYNVLDSVDVLLMTRTNSAYANAGFPYKLGEYLATGNPVISTQVSDISEYLEDKKNAILIEPDNVEDLYSAMHWVMQNPYEANEIGLKGKNVCKQYFNPVVNSNLFYKMLTEC